MDKFFAQIQKGLANTSSTDSGTATKSASAIDDKGRQADGDDEAKPLPPGVVLGKDGKPCRSCTSSAAWMQLMKQSTSSSSSSSFRTAPPTSAPPASIPSECPPDVDTLGRHSWTLLHAISATYPERATRAQQSEMRQFLALFGKVYPCWSCAEDFQAWMARDDAPDVSGQEALGRWMCRAHNEVNRKLGKREFDCDRWRERWVDGGGEGC